MRMLRNNAAGKCRLILEVLSLIFVLSLAGCGGGSSSGSALVSIFGGGSAPAVPTTFPITGATDAGGGSVTFLSINTLTAGAVVTITGTTDYNGTWTVLSATPTSFTVAPTGGFTTSQTGFWQAGGGVIPGCVTTATAGSLAAITLPAMANLPSRLNGVAPLAVFFDTAGTTGTSTSLPFHELEYRWNFGDNDAVTWGYGSHVGDGSIAAKKNRATGPVAAHVYETPGTYTINLTVTDGTNTVSNSCLQIVVSDPDVVFSGANTICFSTAGNFAGCPAGAQTITDATGNFVTALATYVAPGKRLLFRRGETWNAAAPGEVKTTGPGIVGAFGAGAKPMILGPVATAAIQISSPATPNTADWRFIDLAISGQSGANSTGFFTFGGAKQITILRADIRDIHIGVSYSDGILDLLNTAVPLSVPLWDQMAVVDSTIDNVIGGSSGYGIYAVSSRFMVLGNMIGDTTAGEHGMRSQQLMRAVLSSNNFGPAATGKSVLTIRAPDFILPGGVLAYPVGTYSETIVVSDNKFIGGNNDFTVANGTANFGIRQLQRFEIWERNWFVTGVGTQMHLDFSGCTGITVRNNLFDSTGGAAHGGMSLDFNDSPSLQFPCDQVWIYNNTFFSADASGSFRAVWLSQALTASNVTVRNNLAYAPLDAVHTMVFEGVGGPTTNLVQSNNSSNAQVQLTAPGFVGPLTTPAGFRLAAPSYIPGAGIPVFSDFFNLSRPNTGAVDIGAMEF